ncbi:unnamed protein product, partial [Mesorhabditis spiculigera]
MLATTSLRASRLGAIGHGRLLMVAESELAALRSTSTKPRVEKSNWKHNVVYLYQFPRTPYLPNPSPYCLKIETYLRVNNLKYELNGEQISDSQIILWRLAKLFEIQDPVSGHERGTARAIERMLDMSTVNSLNHDRMVKHAHLTLARNVSGVPLPAFASNFLATRFAKKAQSMINRKTDRLSAEELKENLKRDIQAVADVLDTKKFLFGDRMTIADCTAFGHLGTSYFLPFRQHITDLLDDDHPRVKNYLERIRAHYWQDWKLPEY